MAGRSFSLTASSISLRSSTVICRVLVFCRRSTRSRCLASRAAWPGSKERNFTAFPCRELMIWLADGSSALAGTVASIRSDAISVALSIKPMALIALSSAVKFGYWAEKQSLAEPKLNARGRQKAGNRGLLLGGVRGELQLRQPLIKAAFAKQAPMRAFLRQAALIEPENAI